MLPVLPPFEAAVGATSGVLKLSSRTSPAVVSSVADDWSFRHRRVSGLQNAKRS
jgi:hypothetical protein